MWYQRLRRPRRRGDLRPPCLGTVLAMVAEARQCERSVQRRDLNNSHPNHCKRHCHMINGTDWNSLNSLRIDVILMLTSDKTKMPTPFQCLMLGFAFLKL
ncbi:hypothetical protein AAFF_G00209710, partial [Aldrovandia affinis]